MSTPFEFLKEIDNESILFAVTDEHPQTIAVILSCMQPSQAAWIIESLPPERQLAVIRRIVTLNRVEWAVLILLEEELMKKVSNKKYVKLGGIDNVAEALTLVEPGTFKNIMENLGQDDPELVEDIEQSMHVVQTIQKREESKQQLCPTCNFPLVVQYGRNGRKYWCSRCRDHKNCDAVLSHNYNAKTMIIK